MRLKIKNIFAALLVVSALSSCDDALDKFPLDSLSPETFFSNETELQAYANTLYTMFPGSNLFQANDDLIIGMSLINEIRGGRTVDSGSWSWTALRKINTLIEYSVNCKDEAVRTQYVALARFFRAYFYFEKVKQFGDVPWTDKALGSGDPDLYRPRDSREFIMQKMLEDIDFAIEHLPVAKSDYTVTKWTALAFKSRFCLFEGTFRKYHAGNQAVLGTLPADANDYTYYLNLAAEAADEFMTSSSYKLYTAEGADKSYIGLFTKKNVNEGTNVEVILARDYNIAYSAYHNAGNYITSPTLGRPGMTKKFVNSYLMKNGTRFQNQPGWATMSFVEETKNRDPRFAQSVRTPGYTRMGTGARLAVDLRATVTGYSPIKYFTTEDQDAYNGSDCDLIIFRTAEVYLNYAEAKAELGTINQTDIDKSIKLIRERVGMPNMILTDVRSEGADPYLLDKYTGYPKVATNAKNTADMIPVILEIRRERTIELIQEGHRYYDVIRWAEGPTFETPLQGIYFAGEGNYDLDGDGVNDVTLYAGEKAPAGSAMLQMKIGSDIILSDGDKGYFEHHKNTRKGWKWEEGRDYYYGIPTNERSLTHGALTQNPGWEDGLDF